MEYSACLHLRLNAAALLPLHLEATTKYHQGNLHGENILIVCQSDNIQHTLENSLLLSCFVFSLFTGALSPSFAFSEHIHQRLPDGPVRCRHMVTIRHLDVSG